MREMSRSVGTRSRLVTLDVSQRLLEAIFQYKCKMRSLDYREIRSGVTKRRRPGGAACARYWFAACLISSSE